MERQRRRPPCGTGSACGITKSARYSIEQPLVLGGAFGGADADQMAALRRFGHPVGMAFQLRDDVLGVFGDASVTGNRPETICARASAQC